MWASVDGRKCFGSDPNARRQHTVMVPIINVSGWITKRCASKVSWCVEQSGIPLRQSSEPLWAFPQMCAAFIKLGCVIAQTAHLHPYFANTWNLKRCCPGLVFAVVLPGA